jgi:hypothetical protein
MARAIEASTTDRQPAVPRGLLYRAAMLLSVLVWLGSSALVFGALIGLRWLSLKRGGRLANSHWKGMVGLALALGVLPVILMTALPGTRVAVPDNAAVDQVLKQLPGQKK